MKKAIFNTLLAINTIIFGSLSLVLFPFDLYTKWSVIKLWPKITIWLAKVIYGIKYKVKGLENIPNKGAIYMSKHQSEWETFFYRPFSTALHAMF